MSRAKTYVDIRGYHKGVTGSCIRNTVHFSSGEKYRFLIDYGIYQGEGHKGIEYNDSVNPKKIDSIIITHTHADHDGALPIFIRQGYTGKIYMSESSAAVIDIGLQDSYSIMKRDSKTKNRPILFFPTDIIRTQNQIEAIKYEQSIKIHDNITLTFFNNGHLIGASVVLVQIHDYDGIINLLYTGDYKPDNMLSDIKPFPSWVYSLPNLTIITESTYGTTNSYNVKETWKNDIIEACSKNFSIFSCGFGQGRIQELMYCIKQLQEEGEIPLDYFIGVDGVTSVKYTQRYLDCANILNLKFNFLPYNVKFINDTIRPLVLKNTGKQIILSTSGMGSHGPAAIYIPHFLTNPKSLIYFPGYTAKGTLGRKVFEADYDEEISFKDSSHLIKRAIVKQTSEFSSHAKADELIMFLNQFKPRSILINHGEPNIKIDFEERVKRETDIKKTGILGMGYVYRIDPYGIAKSVKK